MSRDKPDWFGPNRDAWDRGNWVGDPRDYPRPKEPEGVPDEAYSDYFASVSCYKDDTNGTYTGTAGALLTNPCDQARYVLKQYLGLSATQDFITDTDTYGNWTEASYAASYDPNYPTHRRRGWASMVLGAGQAMLQDIAITHQMTVEQAVNEILSVVPGALLFKDVDGKLGLSVWIPRIVNWTEYNCWYRTGTTANLDPLRTIVSGNDGLQLEINTGDVSDAINNLEVRWGGTYGRKRSMICNKSDVDDGYGSSWSVDGIVPFNTSGLTYTALCYQSAGAFGENPLVTIDVNTRSLDLAKIVGSYMLCRYWRPIPAVRFLATPYLSDMMPGQIFTFDDTLRTSLGLNPPFWGSGSTWDSIYWRATSIEEQEYNGGRVYEITAEAMPDIVGSEIGAFGMAGGVPSTDYGDLTL